MKVTIWHNPRCGTSRKTLALLQARGLAPEIVEYLKTPPSAAEIERVGRLMGKGPAGFLRTRETLCRDMGLARPEVSAAELVAAMAQHPILIERPIVIAGDKAALGRPPEAVLEIL